MLINNEIQTATRHLAELVAKQQPRGYDSRDVQLYQRAIIEAVASAAPRP